MAKHREADFVIPTIRVIDANGGICSMATIKEEIYKYINLSVEDLTKSGSRNEPVYKQIVGNLVSHRNTELFKCIEIVDQDPESGKSTTLFKINEEGQKIANSYKSISHSKIITEVTIEQIIKSENDSLLDEQDERVINAVNKDGLSKRMTTDKNLSDTVNKLNNYKCQYAKLVGEEHPTLPNSNGLPICIAHHLIPMHAQKDFYPRSLDRASNIVTVCPNCHQALHTGSPEIKRKLLKRLYDDYIDGLNREDIYISFEDLINNYY